MSGYAQEIKFTFDGEPERRTSDFKEVQALIQRLTQPRATLLTNPGNLLGYLDFQVLPDGRLEMEIMEHADNDFAVVDLLTAGRVVEIAMTDRRNLPLKQKLTCLSIDWI
jgi:hypothetical protein